MSKYGVISGPYFPVFGLNTEIYELNTVESEVTQYLDIFHAVQDPSESCKMGNFAKYKSHWL